MISNGFANVEAIGIAHRFETVVSAHEVGISKPDPQIYQACAERMGLAPERMLYVGDDPANDIIGPEAAGLKAAWINRSGDAWPETLGGSGSLAGAPVNEFRDLEALADWLLAA